MAEADRAPAFYGQFICAPALDRVPANFATTALPHNLAFHHSSQLPVAVRHLNAPTCLGPAGLVCDPTASAELPRPRPPGSTVGRSFVPGSASHDER